MREVRYTYPSGRRIKSNLERRTQRNNKGNNKWQSLTDLDRRWRMLGFYTPSLEKAYQEVV